MNRVKPTSLNINILRLKPLGLFRNCKSYFLTSIFLVNNLILFKDDVLDCKAEDHLYCYNETANLH